MKLRLKKLLCLIMAAGIGLSINTNLIASEIESNTEIDESAQVDSSVYKSLREKWFNRLTGNNAENLNDSDYKLSMENLSKTATELWESMNTNDINLWDGLDILNESKDITSAYRNLTKMATAYSSKGCDLYNNQDLKSDIILGIDLMYKNCYNEKVQTLYKNWWDWDIGAPQALCDLLILMYEDLTPLQITNNTNALNRFNPTPFEVPSGPKMTGANLLDTALVSALKGIISDSDKALIEARDSISDVLPYVTSGDGFYTDGSFIQHTDIPYAGGYGSVLMNCMDKLLFILTGTQWEVKDPLISNLYDWIINSFEPLYYKGAIMDMVGGRGITRYNSSDHAKGKATLLPMLQISYSAPPDIGIRIRSFIKENILNDTVCEDYFKGMSMQNMLKVKEILNDDTLPARGDLSLHKVYGAMDRVVHHRPGFSIGISMYSTRIGNFEFGNGENKKGYHMSDGMVFLYNDDNEQYTTDYWPTVDMMRLSGTTTDRSEESLIPWKAYRSTKNWVGGSSILDLYGSTGMEFEMEKTSLNGKKSWFSFDDEIVCLGIGINASDNRLVETIVENRKIKDSGDNTIIINGETQDYLLGRKLNYDDVNWAYLEGNTDLGTDSIGYYFPETTSLTTLRESRVGNWKSINDTGTDDLINKKYVSFAIEHGTNPENEGYSYVILPNKTPDEINEYNQNPDIKILANNEDVQASTDEKLGVSGYNFWNPSEVDNISTDNPCSITTLKADNKLNIGISDPTHTQKEVTITLKQGNYIVISNDDTIKTETISGGIKIIVNTENSMGKTHNLSLKLK